MPDTWRRLVRDRARRDGADLPGETLDELAAHLEDVYTAARARGSTEADAQAQAVSVLDQSTFSPLSRHAAKRASLPQVRLANDTALAVNHRSLAMGYALRMVFRQFRHHPAFALATILVLGLGTGAAAAVYTVVD